MPLWVTAFVVGNLFGIFWLVYAVVVAHPALQRKLGVTLRRLLHCQSPFGPEMDLAEAAGLHNGSEAVLLPSGG